MGGWRVRVPTACLGLAAMGYGLLCAFDVGGSGGGGGVDDVG